MTEAERLQAELDNKMQSLAELNEQVGMIQADIDSIQTRIEALDV